MVVFRRILLALVSIALVYAGVVAGWYAWENHRGAQIWAQTCRDLRAKGESLSAADFIPPTVPNDQNLALAPLFCRIFEYRVDPATGLLTFPAGGSVEGKKIVEALPFSGNDREPSSLNWMTARRWN